MGVPLFFGRPIAHRNHPWFPQQGHRFDACDEGDPIPSGSWHACCLPFCSAPRFAWGRLHSSLFGKDRAMVTSSMVHFWSSSYFSHVRTTSIAVAIHGGPSPSSRARGRAHLFFERSCPCTFHHVDLTQMGCLGVGPRDLGSLQWIRATRSCPPVGQKRRTRPSRRIECRWTSPTEPSFHRPKRYPAVGQMSSTGHVRPYPNHPSDPAEDDLMVAVGSSARDVRRRVRVLDDPTPTWRERWLSTLYPSEAKHGEWHC